LPGQQKKKLEKRGFAALPLAVVQQNLMLKSKIISDLGYIFTV